MTARTGAGKTGRGVDRDLRIVNEDYNVRRNAHKVPVGLANQEGRRRDNAHGKVLRGGCGRVDFEGALADDRLLSRSRRKSGR